MSEEEQYDPEVHDRWHQLFILILIFAANLGAWVLLDAAWYSPLVGLAGGVLVYWLNELLDKLFKSWTVNDDDREDLRGIILMFAVLYVFWAPPLFLVKAFDSNAMGVTFGLPLGMALVFCLLWLNEKFGWVKDNGLINIIWAWCDVAKNSLSFMFKFIK